MKILSTEWLGPLDFPERERYNESISITELEAAWNRLQAGREQEQNKEA